MAVRRTVMSCLSLSLLIANSVCFTGCSSETADANAGVATAPVASTTPGQMSPESSVVPAVPPTDVVRQFLDLIRRGGADSSAATLLTAKAQSELKRIGRTVQPIGSPDARFKVTRAESMPENENAALVHSVWSEPQAESQSDNKNDASGTLQFQVVWAMQKEAGQWRISGLAMELDPAQDPLIVNFEDGNRMAQLLADTEENENSPNSQASNPASGKAPESQAAAASKTIDR